MKTSFLWFGIVILFSVVSAKTDYFPDASEEEDYKKLQEIAKYLQKRVEEAESAEDIPERFDPVAEVQSQSSKNELNPPFEYSLPSVNSENDFQPFAVGPFDPRYYQDFGRPAEGIAGVPDAAEEGKGQGERPEEAKGASGGEAGGQGEVTGETSADPMLSYVRQVPVTTVYDDGGKADIYFTAIVAGCSAAAVVAVVGIGIGCYRLQKNAKAAADVEYPAYGVTGPNKDISPTSGDRRLAQSAQMYHYQHQKQQIIAMESMSNKERRSSISDAESEEENEEGDYTVYECPGLAPTGEMEVKNPLFQDDQTPASRPANEKSEESRELPNLISFD